MRIRVPGSTDGRTGGKCVGNKTGSVSFVSRMIGPQTVHKTCLHHRSDKADVDARTSESDRTENCIRAAMLGDVCHLPVSRGDKHMVSINMSFLRSGHELNPRIPVSH